MTRQFRCVKCGAETVLVAEAGAPVREDVCFACGYVGAKKPAEPLPWWLRRDWRWRGGGTDERR